MNQETLIEDAFRLPPSAIPYYIHKQLTLLFPEKALLECESSFFDVETYAEDAQCTLKPYMHSEFLTDWEEPDEDENPLLSDGELCKRAFNAWLEISWQGETYTFLKINWMSGGTFYDRSWLLADTEEAANSFIEAVCRWNAEVRGEILVFNNGGWCKEERLFHDIKNSTFDNLILEESLKQEIFSDLERFFETRAVYNQYHIPWKRGLLFIGTPGNGKTHTVKALINFLQKPCLYVKSFKGQYNSDDKNISSVFVRARKSAPCVLVLEDLDSLLTNENRSFFLNELDGFASNTGIILLATTNHPEKLDPSLLDRPSRFDRKYFFPLPSQADRIRYIQFWNASFQPDMRLSSYAIRQVAELTQDFSFAYLKELFLSSIMKWAAASEPMDVIILEQVTLLQQQMLTVQSPVSTSD